MTPQSVLPAVNAEEQAGCPSLAITGLPPAKRIT
jgi:hypothetical protein